MIEYLCDNFPHLGHEIINKMSYSSLTRSMDSSKTIESFVKKGDQYLFIHHLNICTKDEEEEAVPETYNDIDALNRLLEIQGKKQLKHTFIRIFEIDCDFEKFMDFLEKANYTITCLELHLNDVVKDSLVSECVRSIKPEKLVSEMLEEYNNDFLENPQLMNINEVHFSTEKPLSIKLSGTKIRKITANTSDFFEDDIMDFTERFLEGTLAVRRFLLYSDVPLHFRQKFISCFENQITKEANDFIRLKSKTEEAFIMINYGQFFFRSAKTANREILEEYFNMPFVRNEFGNWDWKFPQVDKDDSFYFDEDNNDE